MIGVDPGRVAVVADREFRTLLRSRILLAVAGVFVLVVAGLAGAAVGAPGGYVSLTLDLLTPVEVLVPAVAVAFVYRSIQGDDERGELDVVRTYPITRLEYVAGVYLGRVVGLLAAVLVALLVAGVVGGLEAAEPVSFLATHSAGDTPLVYLRFVALTAGYALVAASLALAASAAARRTRDALALGVGVLLLVAVGLDLVLLGLLSGGLLGRGTLGLFLGLSPASAFRGLVVELAVAPALAESPPVAAAAPAVSLLGLVGWFGAAFAAATVAAWRT
jgi:ABC-2 type transport system permease protein